MEINQIDAQILINSYQASVENHQENLDRLIKSLDQPIDQFFGHLLPTDAETRETIEQEKTWIAETLARIEALKDIRGW